MYKLSMQMTPLLFFDFSNNTMSYKHDSLLRVYDSVYEHLLIHGVVLSFSLLLLFHLLLQ